MNKNLSEAKTAKNDEFYTQYEDIEAEINAYYEYNNDVFKNKTILLPCDDPTWSNFTKYFVNNFKRFGIKKLTSTCYEKNKKGKLLILENGACKWHYLEGDGDFRSEEVTKLRDEADIIITNPPFSLFREFLAWIMEGHKQFLIIGNINCITYKEVFPLLKNNQSWLGNGMGRWISGFIVPEWYGLYGTEARIDENGQRIIATNNCLWLTNIDHGKRHKPLLLDTMEHNLKFNKKLKKKLEKDYAKLEYPKYDNYDAIEVPFTECIPSDYDGVMGVPITFLDKFCQEQFEILKCSAYTSDEHFGCGSLFVNNKKVFARILIRKRS